MSEKFSETNRPSHAIWQVQGYGDKARWTRVGAAWMHKDLNGARLIFDAMPLKVHFILREITEQSTPEPISTPMLKGVHNNSRTLQPARRRHIRFVYRHCHLTRGRFVGTGRQDSFPKDERDQRNLRHRSKLFRKVVHNGFRTPALWPRKRAIRPLTVPRVRFTNGGGASS